MTLNKRKLRKWRESMRIALTKAQETEILDRFGTEPEPYEWSEQDIAIQIRNFIESGEFVKKCTAYAHPSSPVWFDDDDF